MAEKQHAIVLSFCEEERMLADPTPPDDSEVNTLSGMFQRVERRLRREPLTIDDAFLLAAELEGSELNAIYDNLVGPAQGTSYVTRKKIETMGDNHPRILLNAAKKFGASQTVVEKLTQLTREDKLEHASVSGGEPGGT